MAKKKKPKKPARNETSTKNLRAQPNEKALQECQDIIMQAVADSGYSARDLAVEGGISIATARKIASGNLADAKLSTVSRILPLIGLAIG